MIIRRPKPIAEQVRSVLRERIRDQTYLPGSRIPSESQLAEELGVSRASVRTALATLATEGLIIRRHGDGTYVSKHLVEVNARVTGIWDFRHWIEDSGRTPTVRLISMGKRPATQQESSALALPPEAEVLSLERIFLADAKPVIYSKNILPCGLLISEKESYEPRLPIHEFLRRYCGQSIAYATSTISAALAEPELEEWLNLEAGGPLLLFVDLFYNADDEPLVFGINYYDDKALTFRVAQSWG